MKFFGFMIQKEEDLITAMIQTVTEYNKYKYVTNKWTRTQWKNSFLKNLRKTQFKIVKGGKYE